MTRENWENKTFHPADILLKHWQTITERYGQKKYLSISSLPEIDNAIWGLKRKSMVVIAGRPGMGKSSLMLQMAYDFALQGRTVYYFSLEMGKEECLERLICNYCNIDNYNIHTGKVNVNICMDKVAELYETLNQIKLVIIESWGRTFAEILEIMDNFEKPDAIFLDYINLIRQGSLSKKDAIDEYIKDVRTLALDKNFCAILGAQINRDVHRNQDPTAEVPIPNMWNIKETGNVEEHSDLILITHWPHYYRFNEKGDISDEKEYIIKVAKNRSGRTGIFVCDFLPQFYRITSREKATKLADKRND